MGEAYGQGNDDGACDLGDFFESIRIDNREIIDVFAELGFDPCAEFGDDKAGISCSFRNHLCTEL